MIIGTIVYFWGIFLTVHAYSGPLSYTIDHSLLHYEQAEVKPWNLYNSKTTVHALLSRDISLYTQYSFII